METKIKDALLEASEKELVFLLCEPRKYRPLWRLMQISVGHKLIPDYSDLTWAERARRLTEIVGWVVDEKDLRSTFVKFDDPKSRKRQKS